jgi:hypothetical protein
VIDVQFHHTSRAALFKDRAEGRDTDPPARLFQDDNLRPVGCNCLEALGFVPPHANDPYGTSPSQKAANTLTEESVIEKDVDFGHGRAPRMHITVL